MIVTTKTLVAEAAKAGAPDVDERHIGYLCRKGVLPHAKRTSGVNGGWAYPTIAPLQLRAYLAVRARLALKDARFVLWVSGFSVEPALAQATMVAYLTKAARHWSAEVAKYDSHVSLVETIGDVLARARSKAPIPRLVDMSLEERQHAYRWMAAHLFATSETDADDDGALAFERAIGRRDRNGELYPEFEDEGEFLSDLPRTDPATLLEAVKGASDLELELTRRFVHMQVVYGEILVRHFAWETKTASPFLRIVRELPQDQPAMLIGLVAAGLSRLAAKRHQPGYDDDLRLHCDALDTGKVGLAILEEFKDTAVVDALPEIDRLRIAVELRRRDASVDRG